MKNYTLSQHNGIELKNISPTVKTMHSKQAKEKKFDVLVNGYVKSGTYPNKRTVTTIQSRLAKEEKIDVLVNGYVESGTYPNKRTLFYQEYKQTLVTARNYILLLLYLGYYGYAIYCHFGDEASIRLTIFTAFGLAYVCWNRLLRQESIENVWTSFLRAIHTFYSHGRRATVIRWFLYLVWTAVLVAYLIINVALKEPRKLIPLGGYVIFIIVLVLFSNNRRKINWHTVFWGSALQCVLGYFIIKSTAGRTVLLWLSDRFYEFMSYSHDGSKYVFGKKYMDHRFVMQAMPTIIMFCAVIQVLIYIGTIPFIVRTVGKLLAAILDVSAPEATNACANIFLGGAESAILVAEYLDDMPTSRLFTLMTNWFASSAGSSLIQFASFGVPMRYLLAASAMSAPAALVCAKITYPDDDQQELNDNTEEAALVTMSNVNGNSNAIEDNATHIVANERTGSERLEGNLNNGCVDDSTSDTTGDPDDMHDKKERKATTKRITRPHAANSIGEALILGTKQGVKLVVTIVTMLIVALSVIQMLDKTVEWFGDRINIHITMKITLSYLLYPVAYIMGVDQEDCLRSGQMLGIRTISVVGIPYIQLGGLVRNKEKLLDYESVFNETLLYERDSDIFLPHLNQTLVGGVFSDRSELVMSYALCGFASMSSIGISVGTLSTFLPHKRAEVTRIAFRALMAGTIASYLTACVAGLLS